MFQANPSTLRTVFLSLHFVLTHGVSIGTPGQPQSLLLDTGSSDIWVEVTYSAGCRDPDNGFGCIDEGSYTNTSSSTYQYVNSNFTIGYGDGTSAAGDYALETFEIGSRVSICFPC